MVYTILAFPSKVHPRQHELGHVSQWVNLSLAYNWNISQWLMNYPQKGLVITGQILVSPPYLWNG